MTVSLDRLQNEKGSRIGLFTILTVLYNRRVEDVRSYAAFRRLQERHPDVRLILADNSTEEAVLRENERLAGQEPAICYVGCGGNTGLSRAYNLGLSMIPGWTRAPEAGEQAALPEGEIRDGWVMLADDDTDFSGEYLENLYRMANRLRGREDLSILCGVVEAGKGWISPRSRRTAAFALSSFLKRPKPGVYRDLSPINSGMCLRLGALWSIGGFDERLFLDQVDFLTVDRLRDKGFDRAGVLPGRIRQSFSAEDAGPGKTRKRWEIFRKDFQTYCTLTGKPWYYRAYLLMRRRLAIALCEVLL